MVLELRVGNEESIELTELAELSVGDHQCAQSLQTLSSLAGILLASILVDRKVRALGITSGDLLRLPDEVLNEFTLILHQEHLLGGVDDIAQVGHQGLSVGRELTWGRLQSLGVQGSVQGNVALFVLWVKDQVSAARSSSSARRTEGSLLFLKAVATSQRGQCGDFKAWLTMENTEELELLVDILGNSSILEPLAQLHPIIPSPFASYRWERSQRSTW